MKKRVPFLICLILATWAAILPVAIVRLYPNRIWSFAGFFQLQYYWDFRLFSLLLMILLVTAFLELLIVFILDSFVRYYSRIAISIQLFRLDFSIRLNIPYWKAAKWSFPLFLSLLACISWISTARTHDISFSTRWFEKESLVCHACGSIDGITLTNSLEAFQENYKKGYRVFEVDLSITADGVPVLEHDWEYTYHTVKMGNSNVTDAPTHEEFMAAKFYNKYTPMDIPMILALMEEYPDIYVMTDFKVPSEQETKSAFQQIVQASQEIGNPALLDRFIVQIYSMNFKTWVDSVYEFENYVYTCYMAPQEELVLDRLVNYCASENIPIITMHTSVYWSGWSELGATQNIQIYVHTENDPTSANAYVADGVSGIYTDSVLSSELNIPLRKQPLIF